MPGIRTFSAAVFATTFNRSIYFRRLRHLWIVQACTNWNMSLKLVVEVSMMRYLRKSSRFFKFLKFQKIKNVTVECDFCNYAGFGNDYRYIGTVDDLFEHFWSFWVRYGASMSTFPLDFYIVKSNFFLTDKITVQKIFFWKSNNGFPLMALKLTYMWNIVAKLAKLQKSIFSRVTPTCRAGVHLHLLITTSSVHY